MKLVNAAFGENIRIPAEYARTQGQPDRSPLISWTEPPGKTRSFVLICIDSHPVARNWVHWILFNLPAAARQLDSDQVLRTEAE